MEEKNYCVYKHTSPSNKVYIGITSRKPERRWGVDGNGYVQHKYFYNAIQKYGWDNIKHDVLFENLSKEEACQKETELITLYKSNDREFGYNQTNGGEGTNGYHHTEKAKQNMSLKRKGKKFSDEHRKKISDAQKGLNNYWYGKKHPVSPETRKKISDAQKGELNHMWGKHHTEEHNKKVSMAVKEWKTKVQIAYKEYKENGGTLKWNEFQKEYNKVKL